MPQKRNPVPIEHMRHLASVTAFRCDSIVNTMHNTPFQDMNDSEGEVQAAGYAAFESGARMLDLMTAFLPACAIDGARVAANGDAACVTVTELADTLVRAEGLSFRRAHEVAALTASAALTARAPLSAGFDAFARAFAAVGRPAPPRSSAAAYAESVSLAGFIARRDRPGGPAPAALHAALAAYARGVHGGCTEGDTRIARRDDASRRLNVAFGALLEAA